MDPDRFERLTTKQSECLRLVGGGYSEKRVAQALGISPYAVKERLRAARKVLGIDDSWAAGRQFLDWEEALRAHPRVGSDDDAYTRSVDEPEMLAEPGIPRSFRGGEDGEIRPDIEVREHLAAYRIDLDPDSRSVWSVLFPPRGRRRNDLSLKDRIAVVVTQVTILAVSLAALVGAIIAAATYLAWLNKHGG